MDKKSIFRRESLDRVESPEQLDAYIKVSHPKVWLIMAALLVAVISVIVWSVVGSLPQTMTVKGVTVAVLLTAPVSRRNCWNHLVYQTEKSRLRKTGLSLRWRSFFLAEK